jgi:sugar phosphate isomerase/epimerase
LTDRRTFLVGAGVAAIATAAGWRLSSARAAARRRPSPVGLQLYTVREAMARDFSATLQHVAEIGYEEVEFAGYFDRTPAQVRGELSRLGLRAPSTHFPFESLGGDWERALENAREIGHSFVVVPWIPVEARRTLDGWKRIAEQFNRVGAAARSAGLRFAYHNHDFEFARLEGQIPFDLLIAETDPALVSFQLDLYWITRGSFDPLAYFERHPGRFPMVHVKDSAGPPDHRMVDVGQGSIEFPVVLARAAHSGTQHFFVEHDQPADPFSSIRTSYEYLASLPF